MNLFANCLVRLGVCVVSIAAGSLPAWAADPAKPVRSGSSIYSTRCASCHDFGMRGSPKLTDKSGWAPRLAQGKDKLYEHAIKGLGWMPGRGACSSCSDDDIKAAVDYMLSRMN